MTTEVSFSWLTNKVVELQTNNNYKVVELSNVEMLNNIPVVLTRRTKNHLTRTLRTFRDEVLYSSVLVCRCQGEIRQYTTVTSGWVGEETFDMRKWVDRWSCKLPVYWTVGTVSPDRVSTR